MKMGILCTMINSFGRRGFYNTQEIGLGRALVRKGHTVTIYKCLKKNADMKAEKIEIEPGLIIFYLPIGGLGAHGYLKSAILTKDMDGLLCFSDNQIFLLHIYRFCRKNGICFVPYVGTTHSVYGGFHGRVMNAWFAAGTLRIFKKNHVIAKTEGAKKELEDLGVRNITVAPVGLDVAVLKSDYRTFDKVQLRSDLGFEDDDIVLCNVSRLEADKRPLDLIEILQHIKDKKKFKLLLIGEGPLRREQDKKIEKYGIADRIKRINRVPYQDMWKIYVLSDYFLNLNKEEIFGMAIMEAVYYETSVAASLAPGPSLTLKGMAGHCLCADDRQIENWLTGEYPSEKALRESSDKMLRNFTWDRCADAFVMIVNEQRKEIDEKA